MNFVDHSFDLFNTISQIEFIPDINDNGISLKNALNKISAITSSEELDNIYISECNYLIKSELSSYAKDIDEFIEQRNIFSYHKSMSFYTLIYFFWIWNHEFDLSSSQLGSLQNAIYLDAMGYKMLDEATDNEKGRGELVYLGLNAIRKAERILQETFPNSDVLGIIDKYQRILSEFEYKEKKHRWSNCPVNWDEASKLGYKAAPLYSVFEIIAANFGLSTNVMDKLVQGMIYTTAAMQIMDDYGDSFEDLNNGIESLVMSGFYSKFGNNSTVLKSKIDEFLDQARLKKIFVTATALFENARTIFNENNDDILGLFNEIQNYRFFKVFTPIYSEN